jgi:hypothetical protein
MFNLEAFQDLCRRASREKDPAELATLKEPLRIMLRFEGVAIESTEKKLNLKPN